MHQQTDRCGVVHGHRIPIRLSVQKNAASILTDRKAVLKEAQFKCRARSPSGHFISTTSATVQDSESPTVQQSHEF
jgi:hypothetical protein